MTRLTPKLLGGVVYPLVFRALEPSNGFSKTTIFQALLALVSLLTALSLLLLPRRNQAPTKTEPKTEPKTSKSLGSLFFDNCAFKEPTFVFYLLANFFIFVGYYIPFFYIPTYAQTILHTSQGTAFDLLAITHGGGILGRIVLGYIAASSKRLGAAGTHAIFAICTATLAFAWMGVHDLKGMIVWCVLWGFFTGAHSTLPPTVTAELCPNKDVIGTRTGMVEAIAAPAILIGNPISGILLDLPGHPTKSSFIWTQAFSGSTILLGALAIIPVWWSLQHQPSDSGSDAGSITDLKEQDV